MTGHALQLIQNPQTAAVLLNPARLKMLELLGQPDSASGLARHLKLPRQQVNYHLRELEREGFVELVEERRKGNCIERMVRAKARSYLLSPQVLGSLAADPDMVADKLSASYLLAVAAKAIREIAVLGARARKSNKRVSTLTLQVDVRFASAAARNAFSQEMANTVAQLVTRYHDEKAENGRTFRFFAGAYPAVSKAEETDTETINME